MLFEEKIKFNRNEFTAKIRSIAADLKIEPDWLMAVINSETGETFSPQVVNRQQAAVAGYDADGKIIKAAGVPDSNNDYERAKYRATGLIQFMPQTAKWLGTSTQALYKMTALQQLDYVHKYFAPYKGKIREYADLYVVAFYPDSLMKSDDWVFPQSVFKENSGLDVNGDGKITLADFKAWIYKRIPAQFLEVLKKKEVPPSPQA